MTSRQDPGIGGIRDPKHEVAAGMHKAQRNEIGPDSGKGGDKPPSLWNRLRSLFNR